MNLAILLTIQTLGNYFEYIYKNAKHPSAPGRKIHYGLKRIAWLAATNYGIFLFKNQKYLLKIFVYIIFSNDIVHFGNMPSHVNSVAQ